MQSFFEKVSILPSKEQPINPLKKKKIKHDDIVKEQKRQQLGNLGIPLLPIHKMDLVEKNKLQAHLFTRQTSPTKGLSVRDWREMNIMLPIYKQSGAMHSQRSDLITKPEHNQQEDQTLNVMHYPEALLKNKISQHFHVGEMSRKRHSLQPRSVLLID